MRKLFIGLVTVLLWIPLASNALGLGSVRVHSALNQILDAEIELLSVTEDELQSVSVTMASYETFARVGIDRPSVLMSLRFNVSKNSTGQYVVQISSREAIREPFLDFIIEVNWRSGRVLREYTVLLDPPDLKKQLTRAVQSPQAAYSPEPTDNRINRSGQEPGYNSTPMDSQRGSANTGNYTTAIGKGELVYGPVKEGDTLWSIATKMRPNRSVSLFQVMKALQEENPDAFIQNNINRLRKGSVLNINDATTIVAINREEARMEITRLSKAGNYGSSKEGDKIRSMASTVSPDMIGMDVAVASRPNLKLVTPDDGDTNSKPAMTSDGVSDESLRKELMLALELSETQRQENSELKTRMQEMQKQLDALQRLIALKDNDLAQLQSQMGGVKAVSPTMVEQNKKEIEKTVLVKDDQPTPANETATTAAKTDAAVKPAEPVKPPKPPVAQVPKVTPPSPPPAQPSFIESLLGNQSILIGGASLLILILLLGMVIMRRRKKGFQESILSGGTSSMMNTKEGDANSSNTSFLSDLAISGIGPGGFPSDDGDVDPMTEADVYMAYGRNQQAEELLKSAIAAKPDRLDYSHKLLEVYYNSKNREKFEAHINDVAEALQSDESMWNKIVAMGHQIAPENPLFVDAPDGVELPEMGSDMDDGDSMDGNVLDIGLDLDELSAEMEMDDDDMDFDLGLDFSELDDILGNSDNTDNSLDFSMDSDKSSENEDVSSEEEQPEDETADNDDLDMELDGDGEDELNISKEESSEDFGAFNFDMQSDLSESNEETETDSSGDSDELTLEFDQDDDEDELSLDDSNDEGLDDLELSTEALDDTDINALTDDSEELSLDLDDDVSEFDFNLEDDASVQQNDDISFDEESLEAEDFAIDIDTSDQDLESNELETDVPEKDGLEFEISEQASEPLEEMVNEETEFNLTEDEFEDDIEFDDLDDETLPELDSMLDIESELDNAIAELDQPDNTTSKEEVGVDNIDLSFEDDDEEDLDFDMSTEESDDLNDVDFEINTTSDEDDSLSLDEDLAGLQVNEEENTTEEPVAVEETTDTELTIESEANELSFEDDTEEDLDFDMSTEESDELNDVDFEISTVSDEDESLSLDEDLAGLQINEEENSTEEPVAVEEVAETELTIDSEENEISLENDSDDLDLDMLAESIDELSIEDDSSSDEISMTDSDEDSISLDDFSFDAESLDADQAAEEQVEGEISLDSIELDADDDLYAELESSISAISDEDGGDDLNIELDSSVDDDLDTEELDSFSFTDESDDEDISFEFDSDDKQADDLLDEEDLDFTNALNDLESFTSEDDDLDLDGDLDSELISVNDEIGTKLDLARAYIDMGDAESAQGMLSEVVESGDDEQRQQAQALLNDIK